MLRGEIDFAILPTVMAVNLYNKGLNYKMIACPVWGTLYLLTNDTTINALDKLENNETAVFGQGVTPDILFRNLLEQKNIKNVRINYSFTANADVAQALLQRKVKTAVLSEPP
jgi:NitT/TauT family transport system substrate-binding protein